MAVNQQVSLPLKIIDSVAFFIIRPRRY